MSLHIFEGPTQPQTVKSKAQPKYFINPRLGRTYHLIFIQCT